MKGGLTLLALLPALLQTPRCHRVTAASWVVAPSLDTLLHATPLRLLPSLLTCAAALRARRPPPLARPGTTVYALYDYTGTNSDELSFAFDDEFTIQESISLVEPGWIKVTNSQGALGIVPANYVEIEMDT